MKDIIIIGAGGHAAELDEYIRLNKKVIGKKNFSIAGFIDDNPNSYSRYKFSAPFLGTILEHVIIKDKYYIIGVADLRFRRSIVERFISEGANFTEFVHHSSYISSSAKIGQGCIIGPNTTIGPNVIIGKFNLVNSRCTIGHDTFIGDYNFIAPNVCFSGFTQIGNENLFGINSTLLPEIRVGNNNRIMAGMVIDNNVGDDSTVFYRFRERVIAVKK